MRPLPITVVLLVGALCFAVMQVELGSAAFLIAAGLNEAARMWLMRPPAQTERAGDTTLLPNKDVTSYRG